MKNIFRIYIKDLKGLVTNWAALITIGGLVILPSLYAWFNIVASWDPYSNTEGLKIAVSNNDKGTTIREKKVNIGDEIVDAMEDNEDLGWTFVKSDKEAVRGVELGDYYASLIIPEDFSENISSVITGEPIKPEIIYYVNEKANAIAPKITSKGATSVVDEVSTNFVKTSNKIIFKVFNDLGIELERELPSIRKLEHLVFTLEKRFPEFTAAVNTALDEADKAAEVIEKTQSYVPVAAKISKDAEELASGINEYLDKGKQLGERIEPTIKKDLALLTDIAHSVEDVSEMLQQTDLDPEIATGTVEEALANLEAGIALSDKLSDTFKQLNEVADEEILASEAKQLENMKSYLQEQKDLLATIKDMTVNEEKITDEMVSRVQNVAKTSYDVVQGLNNSYDSEIKPKITSAFEKAKKSATDAEALMTEANKAIPEVDKMLQNASNKIATGKKDIIAIQNKLPGVEEKITETADRIRDFKKREDLEEIIGFLKNDFEKESDFFAEPVLLKEKQLFPIPNYGSAMSPFFTTLAFWVGSLLLISLLTTEVSYNNGEFKSYEIYLGRLFTFLTLGLLQSIIVTVGDIYIVEAYVADKQSFILYGLLISAVFTLIVYTLVSIFGNVGKALAIILLVLQIAGSGGTFPIQVTPPFFQTINPFLPFTYAISLMREAVGGVIPEIVMRDMKMLAIYAGVMIFSGILLKKPFNKLSSNFVNKAKESDLIH